MIATIKNHIPSINDLAQGMETTLLLLRLKMRSGGLSPVFIIGFIAVLGSIAAASYTGEALRSLAQGAGGTDTAIQQIAINYLTSFVRGEIGTYGGLALAFCVMSAIIAPLTGSTSTSLYPVKTLESIRLTRWHRFTDSVLLQFTSSIAFLQLLTLTGITGILTIEGGREMGMAFTWVVWLALVSLSGLSTWTAELLNRKYGFKVRMIVLGSIAVVAGMLYLLFPDQTLNLFGLGTLYADVVQGIHVYDASQVAVVFGILAVITAVIFAAGAMMSSFALSLPENSIPRRKFTIMNFQKTSKYPIFELMKMFVNNIARAPETRKPLMTATILGIVVIIATSGAYSVATTFTIMIPLVVGLAWGANVFGVIGKGMTWLATQPNIFVKMPWIMFSIQILVTVLLFIIAWAPSFLLGRTGDTPVTSILMSAIATTFFVTIMSVRKSIKNPIRTDYGTRGESMLPPSTALLYLFQFSIGPGLFGVVILTLENPTIQLGLMTFAILVASFRMTRLQERWEDWNVRRDVISKVS